MRIRPYSIIANKKNEYIIVGNMTTLKHQKGLECVGSQENKIREKRTGKKRIQNEAAR